MKGLLTEHFIMGVNWNNLFCCLHDVMSIKIALMTVTFMAVARAEAAIISWAKTSGSG